MATRERKPAWIANGASGHAGFAGTAFGLTVVAIFENLGALKYRAGLAKANFSR
jgi:hypothetical protein